MGVAIEQNHVAYVRRMVPRGAGTLGAMETVNGGLWRSSTASMACQNGNGNVQKWAVHWNVLRKWVRPLAVEPIEQTRALGVHWTRENFFVMATVRGGQWVITRTL